MADPVWEVYKDTAGKYRWRLKAANAEVVAQSEGYVNKQGALDGIKAVRNIALTAKIVEV